MKRNIIIAAVLVGLLGLAAIVLYPRLFPPAPQRKILYWTDPMIAGDRSDHPGKSPMGMDRTPVYADELATESTAAQGTQQKSYYTCPMHPSVHKDGPGVCPICGMTLVKKNNGAALAGNEEEALKAVTISPSKQVLASVGTSTVTKRALTKTLAALGSITYAEPNLKHISIRFPGRLDRLFLTYTGQTVRPGDRVAEVYSPDVVSAEQEYLLARDSYNQVKDAADIISGGAKNLLDQSHQKLLLWGITEDQIAALESTRTASDRITIYSPVGGTILKKYVDAQQYVNAGDNLYDVADLSNVWLMADVYESDLPLLRVGQSAVATSLAFPGKSFRGRLAFINPGLDPSTRTERIRIDLPNPAELLKLDMFVHVTIDVSLPPTLVVPASAILSTGTTNIVWVQKSPGIFEPRKVQLGVRTTDGFQVLAGLSEGESVVSSGGYLIDSESQLEASTSAATEAEHEKMEIQQ